MALQFSTFEKRVSPDQILGMPEMTFYSLSAAVITAMLVFALKPIDAKIVFFVMTGGLFWYADYARRNFKQWLIIPTKSRGANTKQLRTFGDIKTKIYADIHNWKTYVGEHAFSLTDGGAAIAYQWQGVHNRFFDEAEAISEHKRRIALLKTVPDLEGLCLEHHYYRHSDTELADAYVREGERIFRDKHYPPIVKDIREQVSDLYKGMSRTNDTFAVLSLPGKKKSFLASLFSLPEAKVRSSKKNTEKLLRVFDLIKHDYKGAKLFNKDEFEQSIQQLLNPYGVLKEIDWRYAVNGQIAAQKPEFTEGMLYLNDTYFKVILLENYPNIISPDWTFRFAQTPIDLHISQVIIKKDADSALDSGDRKNRDEIATTSNNQGVYKAQAKSKDRAAYLKYVADRGIPVADNAYIVTIFGKNAKAVDEISIKFSQDVTKAGGLARDDEDVQRAMFSIRLPAMGRNSTFLREDNGDVLAAMFPFTTFSRGSAKPLSLRINYAGELVAFDPHKVKVAHELIVAKTGGGKDTQFGLKFLETCGAIRYDFIEMGNAYQGAVEAVGGHYCRAKDQVINPLAAYNEYDQIVKNNKPKEIAQFLKTQEDTLIPIIKGFKISEVSRAEEVVLGRVLQCIFNDRNKNKLAPTLPDTLKAFNIIEVETDRQRKARDELGEDLHEFLQTLTGSCFKEEDQFLISPIANAIDFDKFTGDLMKLSLNFTCVRLATNAMSNSLRSQIVFNEYKVLLETAPEVVRWVTITLDRMGRKEWTGFTRITQGLKEIQSVDSEAIDSIPNQTLLYRKTQHEEISKVVKMPQAIGQVWSNFLSPEEIAESGKAYRQAMVQENGQWHQLYLKFPQLLLDLMNTDGEDKQLREETYKQTNDPYKRIELFKKLKSERAKDEQESLI